MERINLSIYKPTKTMKFINGVLKSVSKSNLLDNEDIEFHYLTKERINLIREKFEKIDKANLTDERLIYEIFPIVTNFECDVTFEEFKEMSEIPRSEFSQILEQVIEIVADIFKSLQIIDNTKNKYKETMSELNIKSPEPIKTKEEELGELYIELENCKEDKARKKELLKLITKLELEIEEKNE